MKRLLTILLFLPLLSNSQLLRYSDFEATPFLRYFPSTSGTFFKEGIQAWSVTADNTFYVSSNHSARFELRRTDTGTDSKRAEITIDELSGNVWHDIYIMLPSSGWAPDPKEQVILQAHDRHPTNACSASPPFSIETKAVGGVEHYFVRTRYSNADYCTVSNRIERPAVDLGPVTYDVWVRWTVHITPSTTGTGTIELFKNGSLTPVYSLYNVNTNYVGANATMFWKTGIYKWVWANSGYGGSTSTVRVLYVDNIKVWGPASTLYDVLGTTPPINLPPVVNAGGNVTLSSGATTFTRTATDSDPDGFITLRSWQWWAGPNTPTMVSGGSSAFLSLTGMTAGVYQYRYNAIDNNSALTSQDIFITIPSSSNISPTVSVTGNASPVAYTGSLVLHSNGGADADGTITGIVWTILSGPSGVITNPTDANPLVTGVSPGPYLFEIEVTDNLGATTTATVSINVTNTRMQVNRNSYIQIR